MKQVKQEDWQVDLRLRIVFASGDKWVDATRNLGEEVVAVSDRGLLSIGRYCEAQGLYLVLEILNPHLRGMGKVWRESAPGRFVFIIDEGDNSANIYEASAKIAKVLHYLGFLSAISPAREFRVNQEMNDSNLEIVQEAVGMLVDMTTPDRMTTIQLKLLGIAD
jgi:hypothetical protein